MSKTGPIYITKIIKVYTFFNKNIPRIKQQNDRRDGPPKLY